jgi:predicted nucleic acid-binding protein
VEFSADIRWRTDALMKLLRVQSQVRPDFFIGAHAAVQGWPLLTRDAARFPTYFPRVVVLGP